MTVSFQSISGFKFDVNFNANTQLQEISRNISKQTGVPDNQIDFLFCGKLWKKTDRITDMNLNANSIVIVHFNKNVQPPFGEQNPGLMQQFIDLQINHSQKIENAQNPPENKGKANQSSQKSNSNQSNSQSKQSNHQNQSSQNKHPNSYSQSPKQKNKGKWAPYTPGKQSGPQQNENPNRFAALSPDQNTQKQSGSDSNTVLQPPISPSQIVQSPKRTSQPPPNFDDNISNLISMGFPLEKARNALVNSDYDLDKALELLLNDTNSFANEKVLDPIDTVPQKDRDAIRQLAKNGNDLDVLITMYNECGKDIEVLRSLLS